MAKRRADLDDIMNVAFYESTVKKHARACDVPGCKAAGEHRAPRHRHLLTEYYWFCLEHVKEYNARWDYYAGMSAEAVEADVRAAATWERPTRPFGGNRANNQQRKQPPADSMSLLAAEVRDALQLFGIYDRCDFTAIKVRYKELAKRYHPDAAGAAKGTEEKLKSINAAYAVLKKYSHLFGVMPV
ncbi:MAG: J domain-containing protein [Alphaproteobacteria bacterium]|jgi:hypothetical protein|nr:J domain-containing protein [Alphaproteobacteria bacterium]